MQLSLFYGLQVGGQGRRCGCRFDAQEGGVEGLVGQLVEGCVGHSEGWGRGPAQLAQEAFGLPTQLLALQALGGLQQWQVVEPFPDVVGVPLSDDYVPCSMVVVGDVEVVEEAVAGGRRSFPDGKEVDGALPVGHAGVGKDALGAVGADGLAVGGAEVHDSVVEKVRPVAVDEAQQERFELVVGGCGGDRCADAVEPGNESVDIAVDDRIGEPEGKRGNGGSGVAPHPFEGQQLLVGGGEPSIHGINYLSCGLVEVACAGIVAQPLSTLQHLFFLGGSQCIHRGKPLDEAEVVVSTLLYACLLQYDFRNPDFVRVGLASPGKRAPVFGKPVSHLAAEAHAFLTKMRGKFAHLLPQFALFCPLRPP